VLRLTDGDDAIFLDDRYSVFPDGEGPRVVGIETIDTGAGDNVIWSSSGNDILNGGAGDDQVFGGDGDDVLVGSEGHNDLDGSDCIDTVDYFAAAGGLDIDLKDGDAKSEEGDTIDNVENVVGSAFDDEIKGTNEDNVLSGGADDDRLNGESGAGILMGGLGSDHLDGGKGANFKSQNL
jgi:Ca2+-binding RTX toxin-like protein